MYDEFRAVHRVLEATARKQSFAASDSVPLADYAMIQGLILGMNCRSVVDARFECGYMTAAVGLALDRLPPAEGKCQYVAVDPDREAARFMFYFVKRRYPNLTRRSFVLVGDPIQMLRGVAAVSADLGIVRGQTAAQLPVVVGEIERIVRPAGIICVYDSQGASSAPDDPAAAEPGRRSPLGISRNTGTALTIYHNGNT